MKKIFLLFLFLPLFTKAQSELSFEDISGKWVERTRTDKNSDVAPFKDTLFLEIREDGFMLVRHTIGATFYGTAELKENKLTLQRETFQIESCENGILKLKQGKVSHRFVKQEAFQDAPVAKIIPGVTEGDILHDAAAYTGKWTVYKKTDANFTGKTFYLKMLDIKTQQQDKQFSAEVTFHNMDSLYNSDARIQVQQNELSIYSDNKIIKAKILKNDGVEMILEHGSIHYYLKKLGQ
jgi:hypothetical protein